MSRQIFKDFDEFAEHINGIEGRFVPTAPSSAEWWVRGTQTSRLSLQELQIGGCATFAGSGQDEKISVGLPMTDARSMRIDGRVLQEDCFILMQGAQPFSFAGIGATRWAGITLPFDHPVLDPRTLDVLGATDSVRTRTQLQCMTDLRGLVNRALSLDPEVSFAIPAAAAALEQEISLAVARVLQSSYEDREPTRRCLRVHHARAIARCLELIEASHGQTLLIENLVREAGVSERTLRTVFQEYFGVSPMRLLRARQLWEIRAALLHHKPEETVMQIAERFGIWDFSLFARHYKRLFSELPRDTLQSPAHASGRNASLSWLIYAAKTFHAQAQLRPCQRLRQAIRRISSNSR